ncbi:MAG: hypothetical protein M0Z95_22535 [Actinomycetota bacterium]|jgi:hypothetical protein|nr:hypothetical protein [Actinomycetota bacterium]
MSDPALRPIDRLDAEWEVIGRTADSRHALSLLAAAEPSVAALGAADLSGLVAAMDLMRHHADSARAARLFQAMLRSAGVHPLVPRAALQAMVPGLVGVARRLSWGRGGDWESGGQFFLDAITTAWEVIVEWAGQDRPYAVLDLLSAVRCRLRRQLLHHRELRDRAVLSVFDAAEADQAADPGVANDLQELAREIEELDRRGADPVDTATLYANQVLGISLSELARMTGASRRRVVDRRDRAARSLFA